MKKVYAAKISEIERLVEDLEAFCGEHNIAAEILFAFNLCLDEIFTNIVDYGYKNQGGEIEIELSVGDGKMTAQISDSAPPFDPLAEVADPNLDASLEDRDVGGLGIFFVKKHMDDIAYTRANGRNILRLAKAIPC